MKYLLVNEDAAVVKSALTTERAAVKASTKVAQAADDARSTKAVAALATAAAVACIAAQTAIAVQKQAECHAASVAAAADATAKVIANSHGAGRDAATVHAAAQVAALVLATAVVKARETTYAALLVTRAVAVAAAAVADADAAEAADIAHEVSEAAVAVHDVTFATARKLAAQALARHRTTARTAGVATSRYEELCEVNRLLEQTGVHDRVVAMALQDAMLTRLPEADKLVLAARYIAAAHEDQVGGDWYDAVVLPRSTITLVSGDVMGHDIHAAAAMGQVRNILRALLLDSSHAPSEVLSRLDQAMHDLGIDTMATLLVIDVHPAKPDDPGSVATLRWSNAGHLAPILIHPDGTVIELDSSTDLLLGVQPATKRRDHCRRVAHGSTLLLYTDGLVETRSQSIEAGQLRLLEVVRRHYLREPEAMLDAVIADMVGDRPADDVAVLAVRFHGNQVVASVAPGRTLAGASAHGLAMIDPAGATFAL